LKRNAVKPDKAEQESQVELKEIYVKQDEAVVSGDKADKPDLKTPKPEVDEWPVEDVSPEAAIDKKVDEPSKNEQT